LNTRLKFLNKFLLRSLINANIKFSQMFQDRLSDRTVIFTHVTSIYTAEVIALLTALNTYDMLAKRASEGNLLVEKIPYSDITSIFKTQYNKDNEDFLKYRANVLYKDTEYFQLYYSQSGKPWFSLSSLILERKDIIRYATSGYTVISTPSIGNCKTAKNI
ncbi:hypothetical protein ALC53_01879, partial [Atta colombica]